MPTFEEISAGIYVVTVRRWPRYIVHPHYRGDTFSLVLIGVNLDGDPFNFGIADKIVAQFRVGNARNPNVETEFSLADGSIVLGQTDDSMADATDLEISAISFDAENGYPPGTTQDEIYLLDPTGQLLLPQVDRLYFDIEVDLDPDPITVLQGEVDFTYEVTRINQS